MLRRFRRGDDATVATVPANLAVVLFRSAPVGIGGDEAGNRYPQDRAPCTRCVTALRHEGPLRTRGLASVSGSAVIVTETDELLVRDDIADGLLDKVGPHELELGRVVDAATGQPLRYRQLLPQMVLPRTAPGTTAIETDPLGPPCPVCGRDGHFGTRAKERVYRYRAAEVPAGDLFATWEHFGNSRTHLQRSGNHAAPHLVMAPLLLSWLRDAAVPHSVVPVRVTPVETETAPQ